MAVGHSATCSEHHRADSMDPTELERAAISEGVYPAFLAPIADFAGHLMRAMGPGRTWRPCGRYWGNCDPIGDWDYSSSAVLGFSK